MSTDISRKMSFMAQLDVDFWSVLVLNARALHTASRAALAAGEE